MEKENKQNNDIHIVAKGDNLNTIAKTYNTTISEIVRLNNIENKNLIYVGQILKLPSETTYFSNYAGNSKSIVEALKSLGEKSDYDYRVKIAIVNGIKNYVGTSVQNTKLINVLKNGKLIKP